VSWQSIPVFDSPRQEAVFVLFVDFWSSFPVQGFNTTHQNLKKYPWFNNVNDIVTNKNVCTLNDFLFLGKKNRKVTN
jgi:hypothetical protein